MASPSPNILVLITDQQRTPRHWPEEASWLRDLMPNDIELSRTGLTFSNACCTSSMCSPSRATLLTGKYPALHGVPLTLTAADLRPDPRHTPAVVRELVDIVRGPDGPRSRATQQFIRGALRIGPKGGGEPELSPEVPNMAQMLRAVGYEVGYKGKWHLTQPLEETGWGPRDSERLERDFGFTDWEPPDAGENAKAENFGGGNAGPLGSGWDEVYIRQAEEWLGRANLPEPFCLVVSLVNPHDVLGYPSSHRRGGYRDADFRQAGVDLPPTIDEDLSTKPSVQTMMKMGMTAYLGPIRGRREQLDYVNFYAYLHHLVDEKIGRLLAALGDADDPASMRSRTVVVRCADHGEMGLSHGGLRQKAFNAYEETLRVPLVISNPVLFPKPARTDALASLIDVMPTLATLTGATAPAPQGADLTPVISKHADPARGALRRCPVDFRPVAQAKEADSVQDAVHFTYDDHQAATAMAEAPGQPNRVRTVRTADAKYSVYLDPGGKVPAEYEMYDLARDPDERENLVDVHSGEPSAAGERGRRDEMAELLNETMARHGTALAP